MTPQERAQRALGETIHAEALQHLKDRAIAELIASRSGQSDYREALYRTVQTIDAVRAYLQTIIAGGEIEDHVERMLSDLSAPRA